MARTISRTSFSIPKTSYKKPILVWTNSSPPSAFTIPRRSSQISFTKSTVDEYSKIPCDICRGTGTAAERLVDVAGLEPATPCLQTRQGKTLTALSGVAYTENQRNFRSLKCPEVVPN